MLYAENKLKSYSLLTVQFAAIAFLFVTGSVFSDNGILLLIQLSGIFLGIWALFSMGKGNINISPDLKLNAVLIIKGPYRLLRHPMYLAIILMVFPLLIDHFTLLRLIVFILLIADLIYKLHWEEKLLLKHFSEYSEYRKKSSRLIPFIY
ncbi:MAG: isoprenylcysteine carboxylmethyltransferase family protein [Bacteroidetes bacterium]|nr:isoprenylcysteine carboxylmethyltransferase family protein [Bacteroidota bacterium]